MTKPTLCNKIPVSFRTCRRKQSAFLYRCLVVPRWGIDDSALSIMIEWSCWPQSPFLLHAPNCCPNSKSSVFWDVCFFLQSPGYSHFLCICLKPTLSCETCLVCPGRDWASLQLFETFPRVFHADNVSESEILLGKEQCSTLHLGFLSVWF